MLLHEGQRLLVKDARECYHSNKLLVGQVGEHFFLLCLQVSLLSRLNPLYTACLIGMSSDPPLWDAGTGTESVRCRTLSLMSCVRRENYVLREPKTSTFGCGLLSLCRDT